MGYQEESEAKERIAEELRERLAAVTSAEEVVSIAKEIRRKMREPGGAVYNTAFNTVASRMPFFNSELLEIMSREAVDIGFILGNDSMKAGHYSLILATLLEHEHSAVTRAKNVGATLEAAVRLDRMDLDSWLVRKLFTFIKEARKGEDSVIERLSVIVYSLSDGQIEETPLEETRRKILSKLETLRGDEQWFSDEVGGRLVRHNRVKTETLTKLLRDLPSGDLIKSIATAISRNPTHGENLELRDEIWKYSSQWPDECITALAAQPLGRDFYKAFNLACERDPIKAGYLVKKEGLTPGMFAEVEKKHLTQMLQHPRREVRLSLVGLLGNIEWAQHLLQKEEGHLNPERKQKR